MLRINGSFSNQWFPVLTPGLTNICSGAQSQGRYLARYGNAFPELHLIYLLVSIAMSNVDTVSVSVLCYTVKEYCDIIH